MPASQLAPPERWEQLELLFTSPEQRLYELIRPCVLYRQPAANRARETNTPARTLARHAAAFLTHGMRSLFAVQPSPPGPRLPADIRAAIVGLRAEHPALHLR